MIYLLDTDTVSFIVRKNPQIIKNLIEHENDEICISAITYADLCYGFQKKGSQKLFAEVKSIVNKLTIVDFDDSQSELYGEIRANLEKTGTILDNMDMLIASAALSQNAMLVTHNTRHFSKVKGLKIEDWSTV